MSDKPMGEMETRAITTELRAEGSNTLVGYAAMYNVWSSPLGGFRERIAPGAFNRALSEGQDVRALWNHDPNYVLGRTKSGTLALSSDDVGLRVSIDPPDTDWARGLMESVRRGDVDQMSFQFRAVKDQWQAPDDDRPEALRDLLDVDLFDVSPVTFPAYPQTQLTAREARLLAVVRKVEHGVGLSDDDWEAWKSLAPDTEPGEPGWTAAFPEAELSRLNRIKRRLDAR